MSRDDANLIALKPIRSILETSDLVEVPVADKNVHVQVELLDQGPWPHNGLTGLDEPQDGPGQK
jgi:hypothetical protein